MKNSKHTAQEFYNSGEHYYKYASNMEDGQDIEGRPITQERIDACWKEAVKEFWIALTLGHPKAAYTLYACFNQGTGVKEDEYIAKLMFGVAEKLGDLRCNSQKVVILPSMQPKINELFKLISDTQHKVPSTGVDMKAVNDNMSVFNKAITLPNGKEIMEYFISQSTTNNLENNFYTGESNLKYESEVVGEVVTKHSDCVCIIA